MLFLVTDPGGDEPGTEGAAEGVAPPPPRPGASAPAAGAHQEEREAEEGGGTVPPLSVSENVVNSATFTCARVIHQMKQQQSVLEFQLTPFNILLRAVLSQLQEKDKYSIFAQPVSTKEVGVSTPTYKSFPDSDEILISVFLKCDGAYDVIRFSLAIKLRDKLKLSGKTILYIEFFKFNVWGNLI